MATDIQAPSDPATQSAGPSQQQWLAQLAYETRTRLALQLQQQEEQAQSYLYEINLTDRALLVARHQQQRAAQLREHRARRIALRKGTARDG
ncbi:hypothetical protein [Fibrivirga algicola]|uniref:Uncharacterized protein n=1 Tax=Fibrivirga algicola TaxID=2950420 RepID=A0ABX0QRQ5_9BACT|nr:hypothetical protein [Fibrivirga algicola]NID13438.1 hypothetical protein [Fibrivirga algicola]